MLENAADRAKEHSAATIAQPKRMKRWANPTRQVHAVLGSFFISQHLFAIHQYIQL
jgi:hypothetical protein